jgi:hypothetical protein
MTLWQSFNAILPDDQMRACLETGATLVFDGLGKEWQAVERQVERLGFGDTCFVFRAKGRHGDLTKVTPVRDAA